ncbi:ABC transporter permease/M1 family aminopeptidase [Sphingomonas qomolangmaensis]|uniref:Aminopeptidase n=1 Tax=Sphingomonas qomolangmaensis TaxID=2918765 RepID=A0ABY5LD71_9SPHN|nr:M1 family aminopeptidase [Sphingomonas qomolangmaensis]UUL83978.1 aminopeptidase [Sphingomonas qomolangmaensis]
MFARIAAFELRYQLGSPVFWVVAILFFLLTFGATTIDQIQIGSGGNVHVNSPFAIAQTHLILSIFFMFVTTAFVANVIVRDDESGFGPMVRSTRVVKFDYLIGRFAGALGAAAIAFAAVPLAIWLGSLMPWLDAETLGPNRLRYYAFAYFVLALPNVVLTAAIFFAVATLTRSMVYSYLGVIVFLVGYFVLIGVIQARPEWRDTVAYFEPFGIGAFGVTARYWTAAESNTMIPPIEGALLVNRCLAFGVAGLALLLAYARFSFAERGMSKRRMRRQAKREAKLAAQPPAIVAKLPATNPEAARGTQLLARCRFEIGQVLKSPAFFVLLAIGLANAVGGLLGANQAYGTPGRPLTFAILEVLFGSFAIIPIVIAIYYAGEVVWRDRDRRMHEIVDATALPNWAYMVPKTLAVAIVLFATLAVSVVAAILVQVIRGGASIELGQYLGWYLVPLSIDMLLIAVLAVFLQALSPNKYVGWALMVVYLVATITLSNIGFEHPLYLYGSTGTPQLSDMNGDQVGGPAGWWLRLYWGAFAVILAVLAHLLWRRGTETRLKARLARLPARLRGAPGAIIAAALLVFGATGGFLYWNMNVLNDYRTRDDNNAKLADYEKRYLRYETVRQPSATAMRIKVDLYPERRRMEARGRFWLINDTGAPLETLHVRAADPSMRITGIGVPGARLATDDAKNQYRIYRFDTPLAPGARTVLDFTTMREQRGLRANGDDTRLVANGSFLNNTEFAPQIGMQRFGLLTDRAERRKYGLPAEQRMAKLEDMSATRRNYIANASWVMSDITLSTSADQVPIAPGRRVSDTTAGGRRTARFVSTAPILAFFSVQSARYAEATARAGDVALSVYHHPGHAYNVPRMLAAMQRSLGYFERAFGPYQFDYARVIEFPGYATFAQAFAGTIPYSEKIGFIADTRDPKAIDYVTYVTAHELAHQYWAHQLISADMQGGTMLVETLAQYGALMVMKDMYGDDRIRRFLKYELDNYLRSRGSEAIEELPLNRVENQGYIHYRKGSLAMYLLQDRLGEDRVNAMLAALLDRYRFKGAPYARSTDLVEGFRGLARNDAERQLVADLLERITIYDLKTTAATVRPIAGGRFETTLTVAAGKAYADGKGVEKQAPLNDMIEIGVFTARPGVGDFAAPNVVSIERRPVRSGQQQIRIVTARRPTFAGVDPYNKYVDRNSDDNVVAITD